MLTRSNRLEIEGVGIDKLNLSSVLRKVADACESDESIQIVTVNLNFITLARRKPFFREIINRAHLVVPDGRFILWFSRLLGESLPDQITGHDLMKECLKLGDELGYRMFLLGGRVGVAQNLCQKLATQYPKMRFDGMSGGIFNESGECASNNEIVKKIRDFRPHFLLVALGAPKQDAWISKNLDVIDARVAIGVGGVFDTFLGTLPRAPRWMQVSGLESVFQLVIAPRRYWRRYLLDDIPTLSYVVIKILWQRLFC